jgi:hypothetical protein
MNPQQLFLFFLLVYVYPTLFFCQKQQPKKYKQDVKKKPSKPSKPTSPDQTKDSAFFTDLLDKVNTIVPESKPDFTAEVVKDGTSYFADISSQAASCPKCTVSSNQVKYGMQQYWIHNIDKAFACACEAYIADKNNPSELLRALMTSLKAAKIQQYPAVFNSKSLSLSADPKPAIREWEVLGPFPVGKMEIDGDPAFQSATFSEGVDVVSFLLAEAPTSSSYSELVSEGKVAWKKTSSALSGQVRLLLLFFCLALLRCLDRNTVQCWLE